MRIGLVDASSLGNSRPDMMRIAAALELQLYQHYAPFWQSSGVPVDVFGSLADVPEDASPLVVLDDADTAGALGYHTLTPDGRPYGKAFLAPLLANGGTLTQGPNSLSVTLSHEALEMVGDPYTTFWGDANDGTETALELCDAVEGDAYEVNGISVSNFLGPRWFRPGPGPYDWLGRLQAPFTMTEGGYMIVRSASGDIRQVFGATYPEWKKASKSFAAARTQRRVKR